MRKIKLLLPLIAVAGTSCNIGWHENVAFDVAMQVRDNIILHAQDANNYPKVFKCTYIENVDTDEEANILGDRHKIQTEIFCNFSKYYFKIDTTFTHKEDSSSTHTIEYYYFEDNILYYLNSVDGVKSKHIVAKDNPDEIKSYYNNFVRDQGLNQYVYALPVLEDLPVYQGLHENRDAAITDRNKYHDNLTFDVRPASNLRYKWNSYYPSNKIEGTKLYQLNETCTWEDYKVTTFTSTENFFGDDLTAPTYANYYSYTCSMVAKDVPVDNIRLADWDA